MIEPDAYTISMVTQLSVPQHSTGLNVAGPVQFHKSRFQGSIHNDADAPLTDVNRLGIDVDFLEGVRPDNAYRDIHRPIIAFPFILSPVMHSRKQVPDKSLPRRRQERQGNRLSARQIIQNLSDENRGEHNEKTSNSLGVKYPGFKNIPFHPFFALSAPAVQASV
jgi:hypothetical protein